MAKSASISVGDEFTTKQGCIVKVISYIEWDEIWVKFLDSNGAAKLTASSNIKSGAIINPYSPSVHGVGYLGVGLHKSQIAGRDTKCYAVWHSMIGRCYNPKYHDKQPTYKGCSVDPIWHNFQNFADWFYDSYIAGVHLDKDSKITGNRVYSPNTCSFISQKENNIVAMAKSYTFLNPDGDKVKIYNMAKFCEENSLSKSKMCLVNSGNRNHHKGWKVV